MKKENFIYWFTGLFEGEGTFVIVKGKSKSISLTSTDIDVLKRIQNILNGSICATTTKKENWKQAYVWSLYGEQAKNIIVEMKPHLLQRRSNRADDWLKLYEENIILQDQKKTDLKEKVQKVFDLHSQGLTHLQISQQTDYERSSVTKILNKEKVTKT